MLLLSVLYLLPMVLVAIICAAIVSKVREGRYRKEWMGYGPEAPKPFSAVAQVMIPIIGVLLWAFAAGHISLVALGFLAVGVTVLGYFVYGAAAERYSEGADARARD